MSLRIETHCPTRVQHLHVVLVLPASEAVPARDRADVRDLANRLTDLILDGDGRQCCGGITYHRVGIATYAASGIEACQLTNDRMLLRRCVDRMLRGREGNDPASGLQSGERILRRGREESLPTSEALVLVGGGEFTTSCSAVERIANGLSSQSVLVVTACAGPDCDQPCLRSVAYSSRYFYPRLSDVRIVFEAPHCDCLNIDLRLLEWSLTLPDQLPYVDASASIPPTSAPAASTLSWSQNFIPKQGLTLTYRARPTWRGFQTVPITTQLSFRDKYNRAGDRTSTSPLGISILAPIQINP